MMHPCVPSGTGVGRLPGATELARGETFSVVDLAFQGPLLGPADTPARDVEFSVLFRHAGTKAGHIVHGFWDGDGRGGVTGNVFRVRFCPTLEGRWDLAGVNSNMKELHGQGIGGWVTAAAGTRGGFWLPDPDTPGGRWYRRSDGSHPYIFGNTFYTFVSGMDDRGPVDRSIADDVRANARYFNKLRFGVHGNPYVHPVEKPFFDDGGSGTDDGDYSHRPNPAWFHRRVDAVVRAAFEEDMIADIILNGPDTPGARSMLRAGANNGDAGPYLRYMAARYGGFPNVWMCLTNEYDIREPNYTPAQMVEAGRLLRKFLPYPTPLSVHRNTGNWETALNTTPAWNDHAIVQEKIRNLNTAADFTVENFTLGGGKPLINDELGYEGGGDLFSATDVIEGHLGTFLGGGYGSTGYKPGAKTGHYFWGRFDPAEHLAAEPLRWLRACIDREVKFWKMMPVPPEGIFERLAPSFRCMAWPGHQYVLGTNNERWGMGARLGPGSWTVRQFDAVACEEKTLATGVAGEFIFDTPNSRAVLLVFTKTDESPVLALAGGPVSGHVSP